MRPVLFSRTWSPGSQQDVRARCRNALFSQALPEINSEVCHPQKPYLPLLLPGPGLTQALGNFWNGVLPCGKVLLLHTPGLLPLKTIGLEPGVTPV
ncbi:hypothetical protein E2C01_066582 [Portunus trituberculatus]|uniref:Uncharacterized protein n=1 Tax=Portunus trituberculatus TaxID=210409 RepID=A0A5B7HQ63_PORTR|nr:hypothetical protein [Portunus trituberculatus]